MEVTLYVTPFTLIVSGIVQLVFLALAGPAYATSFDVPEDVTVYVPLEA